jgi:beta-glucosidase
MPDWWSNAAPPGGDILASVSYINTPTGQLNQKVSVYYDPVQLQAGKTVRYVTLPDVSGGVAPGETAIHIFAVAIG